ncbi:MAG: phosphate ABC transporter substrate-binding protein [Candidatus Methanogranum gryphiswaldense]|nr:MAG: phosphate ABC transporter substrate-binding protein [Candidatus Methanogranum sp. U3.2.1]
MNKNMKLLTVLIVAVVVIAGVALVLSKNNGGNSEKTTIVIQGSTTVAPIMLAIESIYEEDNNVDLQITANGSGAGAAAAINGTADLAMLSRNLKDSETSAGLEQTIIGMDGIAIIFNSSVTGVTNLTVEQAAQIFSGEITNWNQVGGNNLDINVISREEGSGTRDGFEAALLAADSSYELVDDAIICSSTNAMMNVVENTGGAIGYISIGYIDTTNTDIIVSDLDGVEATEDNVLNGTYGIQRNLVVATMGEPEGAVADLIDWLLSDEGQAYVASEGFIPIIST